MKKALLSVMFLLMSINVAFSGIDIDTVKYQEDGKGKKYHVEINYPKIRNASTESTRDFNKLISDFVDIRKEEFMKEVTAGDYDDRLPYEFYVNYDVSYSGINFVSVVLYLYYYEGGAHGSSVAFSFNYDLDYNRNVKLSDLFEGNYLEIISDFCKAELMKDSENADADWVNEGAAPKAENYETFTLNEEGLIIHFQQYQVLPYVAGAPDVFIPEKTLKNVVRKDGLLMR